MADFDPKSINALAVNLHGKRVGIINRLGGDQYLFSFEQSYIDDPVRPILSLSFKGQAGGLVTSIRPVTARLPPFFSNLLPEGHLRDYLAARAGVKPNREFFLLSILGADLPGALTVEPLGIPHQPNVVGHPSGGSEVKPRNAPLRFSLAGVQLKFSAILERSGGLTIPVDGMGGSWIVKLPSNQLSAVPENEYVMMTLAREVGIQVPQVKLVNIRDVEGLPKEVAQLEGQALAVERFDRSPQGELVHMEDFAQVFGLFPEDKYHHRSYANIAAVLWAETGERGTYEFFRRFVFSVLIGNGDMHMKNWSLLYPDRRTPVLSPAYDLVATLPYIAEDQLALSFGRSKTLSAITTDQVRRFADTARLPVSTLWPIVVETADRTVAAWEKLAERDLLPKKLNQVIEKQISMVSTNIANAS